MKLPSESGSQGQNLQGLPQHLDACPGKRGSSPPVLLTASSTPATRCDCPTPWLSQEECSDHEVYREWLAAVTPRRRGSVVWHGLS